MSMLANVLVSKQREAHSKEWTDEKLQRNQKLHSRYLLIIIIIISSESALICSPYSYWTHDNLTTYTYDS